MYTNIRQRKFHKYNPYETKKKDNNDDSTLNLQSKTMNLFRFRVTRLLIIILPFQGHPGSIPDRNNKPFSLEPK